MQTVAIKQALDILQDAPQLVAMGQLPDGEILQFTRLGPGHEVAITRTDGQVKHKCFVSLYAFLAWYVNEYVETRRA